MKEELDLDILRALTTERFISSAWVIDACEEIERLRDKLAAVEKDNEIGTSYLLHQKAKLAEFEDDRESLAERGEVLHERIEALEAKLTAAETCLLFKAKELSAAREDLEHYMPLHDRYKEALESILGPPACNEWRECVAIARKALEGRP